MVTQTKLKEKENHLNLEDYQVNPKVLTIIPEEMARRYLVFPLDFEGDKLIMALADPTNLFILDDLKILTGCEIIPLKASKEEIEAALNVHYQKGKIVEEEVAEALDEGAEEEAPEIVVEEAPVVKLANLIITQAVRERASDIHLEPQERNLQVRYRIDGVLQERMASPKKVQAALISRFKIMAGMNVAEHRKPQDGHASLIVQGKPFDFRVATLPTVYGERVVLRILEKESILMDLDDLGFFPETLSRFKASFMKPYGTILVTGPTGSGKSTTLYATLNVLNDPAKNIVTIEDPVEYRLPGVNQVQINSNIGLTFAKCLRAVLRTSPDIVMVGEIRDKETAGIAIEAALTGHLVFSTLHTNDAPSAITRLIEMGIQPFLIASALDCIQAQRLARRLCGNCKQTHNPPREVLKQFFPKNSDGKSLTLYRPQGCGICNNTGYKGRVGLYEVMLLSEEIKQLTVKRAPSESLKKVATSEGMKTLLEDGLEKVKKGITSLEEIMRVIA